MALPVRISTVELDTDDGLIVSFTDDTQAGYITEELLELRPNREPIESHRGKRHQANHEKPHRPRQSLRSGLARSPSSPPTPPSEL
jgi:hypothetical protein